MNYFDPFLIEWSEGQAGQTAAEGSVALLGQLNDELASLYSSEDVTIADVASAFDVTAPLRPRGHPVGLDTGAPWSALAPG